MSQHFNSKHRSFINYASQILKAGSNLTLNTKANQTKQMD